MVLAQWNPSTLKLMKSSNDYVESFGSWATTNCTHCDNTPALIKVTLAGTSNCIGICQPCSSTGRSEKKTAVSPTTLDGEYLCRHTGGGSCQWNGVVGTTSSATLYTDLACSVFWKNVNTIISSSIIVIKTGANTATVSFVSFGLLYNVAITEKCINGNGDESGVGCIDDCILPEYIGGSVIVAEV